jgi:hypothetical protein
VSNQKINNGKVISMGLPAKKPKFDPSAELQVIMEKERARKKKYQGNPDFIRFLANSHNHEAHQEKQKEFLSHEQEVEKTD